MTPVPMRSAVKAYRSPKGVRANIPLTCVSHSPTGWEWGYSGSGPADFALNILNAFVPYDNHSLIQCFDGLSSHTAMSLHQKFKTAFLAPKDINATDIAIPAEEIHQWLVANGVPSHYIVVPASLISR